MDVNKLTAISPVDGRYRNTTEVLANYFSEFALIKYRVWIEVEYLLALSKLNLPQLPQESVKTGDLRGLYQNFSLKDAEEIKSIEKVTNHDVKAVEYFIKKKLEETKHSSISEFVHFGLTSQDINNTAIPLSTMHAIEQAIWPLLQLTTNKLEAQANEWASVPMLARTHGQPASPTRLGKEWQVFVSRLSRQIATLKMQSHCAKFGGATGNFNAHKAAFPGVDWNTFANDFVASLGLKRSWPTTQIEHYDSLAELCHNMIRVNTILIDLSRDIWHYVSMDYFKQQLKEGEVGSSAMPHKVNPIDFENAEGNLGVANALFDHLAMKLPISRLQRDLTDSTVLRNLGVPFAHSMIAYQSLLKGLNKLLLNEDKLRADLDDNWVIVAEAIQTILRREGFPKPYEALKDLTRTHHKIDSNTIHTFINNLPVSQELKKELLNITPFNYTGL